MSILPGLAIVIPAKNEEKYLPNLLASLSQQLYLQCVPTKIYLADARSTDGTVESAFAFRGVLDIEVGLSPDAPHLSTELCHFERSCANLQPPVSEDRPPWHGSSSFFVRPFVRAWRSITARRATNCKEDAVTR